MAAGSEDHFLERQGPPAPDLGVVFNRPDWPVAPYMRNSHLRQKHRAISVQEIDSDMVELRADPLCDPAHVVPAGWLGWSAFQAGFVDRKR